MPENKIELKTIRELMGMSFFIPSYQRGYRWKEQQVKDLLEDIHEFIEKGHDGFYCIQPLVVKGRSQETFKLIKEEAKDLNEIKNYLKGSWEVIDGQQRLTTIYVLLSYLQDSESGKMEYKIEYETRSDSKYFLERIDEAKKDNIDYHHIFVAKKTIEDWFKKPSKDCTEECTEECLKNKKNVFLEGLLDKVKFIWYESSDEDPIKVFTRLNIGKIALTNSELIKALFLNKSNFVVNSDYNKIRLQQQEIATQWDEIEYTLQNDEFWLFLNKADYQKSTRIDFIFDLMCEKNVLELNAEQIGVDSYKTFRYFYTWFKENTSQMPECWKEVKSLFQTFQEWFNDLELYHYIGYLIEQGNVISNMVNEWEKLHTTKEQFVSDYIIPQIKDKIGNIKNLEELRYGKNKVRSILLLHNVQSIINQNNSLQEDEKYKLPVFYKFPFHLFKKESWNVEHIDSYSENQLENVKDQKEWLLFSKDFILNGQKVNIEGKEEDLKTKVDEFLNEPEPKNFDVIHSSMTKDLGHKLKEEEKNMLWNLCLLDEKTNKGYGNDIFPVKRRKIIAKSQGKRLKVDLENRKVDIEEGAIAFIPPCTEKIFQKAYNAFPGNLREWDKKDAEEYLKNIEETLNKFLN